MNKNELISYTILFSVVLEWELKTYYSKNTIRNTDLTAERILSNARSLIAMVKEQATEAIKDGVIKGDAVFNGAELARRILNDFGVTVKVSRYSSKTVVALGKLSEAEKTDFINKFISDAAKLVADFVSGAKPKGAKKSFLFESVSIKDLL